MKHDTLQINGMFCGGCAATVERSLSKLSGVEAVNVSFLSQSAVVRYNELQTTLKQLLEHIVHLGYEASAAGAVDADSNDRSTSLRYQKRLAVAIGFGMWSMLASLAGHFDQTGSHAVSMGVAIAAGLLAIPVFTYAAIDFYRLGIRSARLGVPGMEALISVAIIAAIGVSVTNLSSGNATVYFDIPVMLIIFQLAARLSEHRVRRRASDTVRELLELSPISARLVSDKHTELVSPATLEPGNVIECRPGERIAADGRVLKGVSMVDTSLVTGEAEPQRVTATQDVVAGTQCIDGVITIEVTSKSGSRRIDSLAQAVNGQLISKSQLMQLTDQMAFWLLPVMAAGSVVAFLLSLYLGHNLSEATIRALAVVVVTCPCALAIAIPLATTVATGVFAKQKILVRDPSVFEKKQAQTIVLDKTGTLTVGQPMVANIATTKSEPEQNILSIASVITAASNHPLAIAISRHAEQTNSATPAEVIVQEQTELSGKGIIAITENGSHYCVGSQDWLIETGVNFPEHITPATGSRVCIARDNKFIGAIDFEDQIRPEAPLAIKQLKYHGYRVILASGDNQNAVNKLNTILDLECYSRQSPEDKLALVEKLQSDGDSVVFVGDGLNDAPALAAADSGIAMPNSSDLARSASSIVILSGGLEQIEYILNGRQKTANVLRQNSIWAVLYNLCLLPMAIIGIVAPLAAALAMALSSVSVTLNSLRLLTHRPTYTRGQNYQLENTAL